MVQTRLAVEWTFDGHSAALEDMCVDHGGFNILMPEQFLDGADVVSILKEMRCKGVTKGMG